MLDALMQPIGWKTSVDVRQLTSSCGDAPVRISESTRQRSRHRLRSLEAHHQIGHSSRPILRHSDLHLHKRHYDEHRPVLIVMPDGVEFLYEPMPPI